MSDNTQHSFALGANALFNDKATLRVNRFQGDSEGDAHDLLSGGVPMMTVGVPDAM